MYVLSQGKRLKERKKTKSLLNLNSYVQIILIKKEILNVFKIKWTYEFCYSLKNIFKIKIQIYLTKKKKRTIFYFEI